MKSSSFLLTVLSMSICMTPGFAADTKKSDKPAKSEKAAEMKKADKDFIHNTAIAGMTEVKLGEIAEKNAADKEVKDFAKKMVADHTKANESLKQLATEEGVQVPADLDAKHKALVDKFSKLTGNKFDHDYMDQMITDHEAVIASLKAEAKTGEADLKKWAEETLPTVEGHLKMAKDTDRTIDSKKTK